MPDEMITSKLLPVFKGVVKDWLEELMEDTPHLTWNNIKESMHERFGTDAWNDTIG